MSQIGCAGRTSMNDLCAQWTMVENLACLQCTWHNGIMTFNNVILSHICATWHMCCIFGRSNSGAGTWPGRLNGIRYSQSFFLEKNFHPKVFVYLTSAVDLGLFHNLKVKTSTKLYIGVLYHSNQQRPKWSSKMFKAPAWHWSRSSELVPQTPSGSRGPHSLCSPGVKNRRHQIQDRITETRNKGRKNTKQVVHQNLQQLLVQFVCRKRDQLSQPGSGCRWVARHRWWPGRPSLNSPRILPKKWPQRKKEKHGVKFKLPSFFLPTKIPPCCCLTGRFPGCSQLPPEWDGPQGSHMHQNGHGRPRVQQSYANT